MMARLAALSERAEARVAAAEAEAAAATMALHAAPSREELKVAVEHANNCPSPSPLTPHPLSEP